MKRKSVNEVVDSLTKKNITLIGEYRDNKQKLKLRCNNDHIFHSSLSNVTKGTGCFVCHKINKSLEMDLKIKQIVESHDNKLIEIVSRKQGLVKVECKNSHTTVRTYHDIKNNHDCRFCAGTELQKDEVEKTVVQAGFRLIDMSKGYVTIECSKGHYKTMAYAGFKNGRRCGTCGKNAKKTTDQVIENMDVEGYVLLNPTDYLNTKSKLKMTCPSGHSFYTNYNRFVISKQRCPKCRVFRREEECRSIFEKITGKSFLKCRPDFLRNKSTNKNLELDGYNEELKLAFEYNGEWHYKKLIESRDLVSQQDRDDLKVTLCEQSNVKLIIIPYYTEDLEDFISSQISVNNNKDEEK